MQEPLSEENRIYFRSESHRERFLQAVEQMQDRATWNGGDRLDQEYSAALYILTADGTIWEKAQAFLTPNGIDFKKMLRNAYFSTTEAALVALAGNLFGQPIKANPLDLTALDDRNFSVAVQALQFRRKPFNRSDI